MREWIGRKGLVMQVAGERGLRRTSGGSVPVKNRARSVGWGGGAGGCWEGGWGSRALREEAGAWVCLWVTGGKEAADVSEEPSSSREREDHGQGHRPSEKAERGLGG